MNLIAAVDKKWGIGRDGKLLVSIPDDMKLFRKETEGKVVVMGRKTLESLPQGQALKNRANIILSNNKDYKVKDAVVVHSVEEALEELKKFKDEDIYVAGGESIYKAFLPYCNTAHITKIDYTYYADCFMQDLDANPEWIVEAESDEQTYFNLEYYYVKYVRKQREQ